MFAIINSNKEGISLNNKLTHIVTDLLIFRNEINAVRYLRDLQMKSSMYNDFYVIAVMLPMDFVTFKYFAD